jgi:hypothetical protein
MTQEGGCRKVFCSGFVPGRSNAVAERRRGIGRNWILRTGINFGLTSEFRPATSVAAYGHISDHSIASIRCASPKEGA